MKSSRLVLVVIVLAIGVFVWYSTQENNNTDEAYVQAVLKEREKAETFLKSGNGSPFLQDSIPFGPLNYFPIDPAYRVKAKLEEIKGKQVVLLSTSDGKTQRYLEFAYAIFKLHDQENRLLILESMEMGPQRGKLFLAFSDETSGRETYGAGRYLDVKKVPAATSVELDFNLTYNPYCAYNDKYSCPFPPKENLLKVAIRVGEMNYHP